MDITAVTNLGVAGFAILVMWWGYQASAKRIDERDIAFRALEKEVREKIMTQLNENTRIFERVMERLGKN